MHAVLDDAAALGFARIQFTGGDPLVSPHLVPAVEYAAARGLHAIEVYTNGFALGDTLFEQLRPHGVAFAFSFYSADAAIHDAITRTPGSQRRTLAAIDRALRAGLAVAREHHRDGAEPGSGRRHARALAPLGLPDDAIGMDVQRSVGRGLMTLRARMRTCPAGRAQAIAATRRRRSRGRAAVATTARSTRASSAAALRSGTCVRGAERDPPRPGAARVRRPLLWAEVARREAQLACWECRLRGALLACEAPRDVRRP